LVIIKSMPQAKLKIYLDTNIYGRPFDDKRDPIIYTEAMAAWTIFYFVAQGKLALISSDILCLEVNKTNPLRRERIAQLLPLATHRVKFNNQTKNLAKLLEDKTNIGGYDAVHLSSASIGQANYFITQDKKILKSATIIENLLKSQGFSLSITDLLSFIKIKLI